MSINRHTSTMMLDGCAVRPIKASVAAKHASKMLALLWSCGVFFTAKITNMLSKMVNGQVIVVMIICIIKTTRSVRWNCNSSSDTFLENWFELISDMFVTMAWFGEACSLERPTLPLWLPQKKFLMRTTMRRPFRYCSTSFDVVNLKGMVNFQWFSSMTLKKISFSSLYVILFHPSIRKLLLLTRHATEFWSVIWIDLYFRESSEKTLKGTILYEEQKIYNFFNYKNQMKSLSFSILYLSYKIRSNINTLNSNGERKEKEKRKK